MKRSLVFTLGCLFGCPGLAAASPQTVAVTSPSAPAAVSLLDDGGNKLANNDAQGAIRSLQGVVRAQPGNADAYQLLSIAYLQAGQYAQAAGAAENALKPPAPQKRASVSVLLGKARYDDFLEDYKKCDAQAGSLPNMAQLLSQMATHNYPMPSGDVLVTGGDITAQDDYEAMRATLKDDVARLKHRLDQSEAAYQDALHDDPQVPGVHEGLGLIRAAQGYPGEARHEFTLELAQHGPSGSVFLHLGELDAAEGHDADAIENLRRAVSLAPQQAAPYEALAALYRRQNDAEHVQWAKGMAALRRSDLRAAALALANSSPQTADLLGAQAQLALTQKHAEDARALLARARALDPRDAGIASMLGDVEEAAGHHEQAIALYRQALDSDAADGAAWYGIGLAYDAQNNRESAVADYAQALQINPNNPWAKLNLAADEADLGQRAKAVSELRDYLQRFPTANNTYAVQTSLAQMEAP